MFFAYKKNLVSEIFKKVVPQVGAQLILEPEYEYTGKIIFPETGKTVFFRGTCLNINQAGAVDVAKDKMYSKFFLEKAGFSVPQGQTFFSEERNAVLEIKRDREDGLRYAHELGYPVILKPNSSSQGNLVFKVCSDEEYIRASSLILERFPVMIVEKCVVGRDYRIVVLDDEVISAYERIPLSVEGDGLHDIWTLLEKKMEVYAEMDRAFVINRDDERLLQCLFHQGYTLETCPPKGVKISLLHNANLSTGGTSHDVTEQIHPTYRDLAVRVTGEMGLRLCGVDIMTEDITQPCEGYSIIEINGAPGLDNYAATGDEQRTRVEDMYRKIVIAMGKDRV